MILPLRHLVRTIVDVILYAGRSGHLWMPVLLATLAGAAALMLVVKTVVPTAVYVLF